MDFLTAKAAQAGGHIHSVFAEVTSAVLHPRATPLANSQLSTEAREDKATISNGISAMVQHFLDNYEADPAGTFFKWVLIFSLFLVIFPTASQVKALVKSEEATARNQNRYKRAWKLIRFLPSNGWIGLIGFLELHMYNRLPWAPWNASSIHRLSPSQKALCKRLVRMGIIPLDTMPGGIKTYIGYPGGWKSGWKLVLPTYVQSKSRAHFYFVVIRPVLLSEHNPGPPKTGEKQRAESIFWMDKAREDFMTILLTPTHKLRGEDYQATASFFWRATEFFASRHSYADTSRYTAELQKVVESPLESGALSRFRLLLPFKKDEVLVPGKFSIDRDSDGDFDVRTNLQSFVLDPMEHMHFLANGEHAVVRIEATDYNEHRLVEWVFRIARNAGLQDIWTEDAMARAVATVCAQAGVPPPGTF